jgi:hypothetical protein
MRRDPGTIALAVALATLPGVMPGEGIAATTPIPPRLFVLTDIGNEPDDQMSLTRLLLYSNEIEIEGIAAVTSVWQRDKTSPEIAEQVIRGYAEVLPRLREHASGWPEADALRARLSAGAAGYGLAAIDPARPSPAARALLAAARRDAEGPLWVAGWGGTATLAEALMIARRTLTPAEVDALIGRLRVYSIGDQDDAGPWLRREFPGLFFIVSPSSQDGGDYAHATWTGISGDRFYRNGEGADFTTVSNAWLDRNIRAKGPMGAHYPRYMFIMEGDTPAFLGLIPNGLNAPGEPGWGGWGGRYVLRRPAGESRPVWSQGGDSFMRITSADTVDGHTSDQATIWRWREAFQNDFAARMDWTIQPFAKANHPPVVVVNGEAGTAPLRIKARTGARLSLDASDSSDPDHQRLDFKWFAYPEAGYTGASPTAVLRIEHAATPRPVVTVAAGCAAAWLPLVPCPKVGVAHLILAVTDRGVPRLTRYRRIIVEIADD